MPGMTWDQEADQKLVMAIIATHSIQIDFGAVAATLGNVCTPRAVQERLKKLKKVAIEAAGANLTRAAIKAPKGGKTTKATAATSDGKKNLAPKDKAKPQSYEDNDEVNSDDESGDSEATTELMMNYATTDEDTDVGPAAVKGGKAAVKTQDTTSDEAPAKQAPKGKAKIQKKNFEGAGPAKAEQAKKDNGKSLEDVEKAGKTKAKPERKTLKASGAAKGGKTKTKAHLGMDDADVTAEQGVKRKRSVGEGTVDQQQDSE